MSEDQWLAERREFLKSLIGAASVAGLAGIGSVAPGLQSEANAAVGDAAPYVPNYFTKDEWRFVVAAVDRLIPSNDDGPGAVALQVPRFIDRQMDSEYGHGGFWYLQGPFDADAPATLGYQMRYSPRELYRAAIPAVDKICTDRYGKVFADLEGVMHIGPSVRHV